jgi:hypothetical protein
MKEPTCSGEDVDVGRQASQRRTRHATPKSKVTSHAHTARGSCDND